MTHEQAMRLLIQCRRKRRDYLLVPARWERNHSVGKYDFAERKIILQWVIAMEAVAVEVLTATPEPVNTMQTEDSIIDRIERDGMIAGMVLA